MAQRRSLIEGLDVGDVDPVLVEEFVYNRAPGPAREPQGKEAAAPPVQPREGKGPVGRVGLTTRIRSDFAAAAQTGHAGTETRRDHAQRRPGNPRTGPGAVAQNQRLPELRGKAWRRISHG